jgi:DNA-binding beta-propeller fold protein YncE
MYKTRRWIMKFKYNFLSFHTFVLAMVIITLCASGSSAEILAMLNYESKPDQISRKEGIAIIDVDPNSTNLGKILMDIPLPYNLVNHHIYYNKDMSKAYVTALGLSILHVIDMKNFPYRIKAVEIPECKVLEDAVFTADNKTWYLTCMGSQNIIVGDALTDKPVKVISLPKPYPHGIAIHEEIDRIVVTSTDPPDGVGQPGETVTVIEASSGKVLSSHKVSNKPSPSGEAPVEVVFIPHSSPPMAYIDNIYGGTLWIAIWESARKEFSFQQAFDFASIGSSVPLNVSYNDKGDRLYVTTGVPGHLNIFDISQDPRHPRLLKSIPTAAGAHHVAFSPDNRFAFVQNNLLNLPNLSDGSISVIDMEKGETIASIDTLKNQGLNPNSIILLPEWSKGHGH